MAETNILTLYQNSNKIRVKQARDIPGLAVNFIDTQNRYQDQFGTFQELRKTTYTEEALNFYDDLRKKVVIPESFQPAESGINLNRWGPGAGYYNPGSPQG